ncbi:hypothetical protein [Cryptosporangium aurantiacum]|uniref:Uncharacterized protein n=1 Tax=Cryptosporangium aurantiacum TaxID=134849 RepID=A0A1M7I0R5_9ACTN|nr:hypothetical protein [Cryptosporangium aurantiacum]SHM33987.1 hypothetical protein SAMN05443668_101344 [Cryptosporangium aurantiacum]
MSDTPHPEGGFILPANPDAEQIETAQLYLEQHRPDHLRQCTTLTCAIGPLAQDWPCRRWRWAGEILRRAGLPVPDPGTYPLYGPTAF